MNHISTPLNLYLKVTLLKNNDQQLTVQTTFKNSAQFMNNKNQDNNFHENVLSKNLAALHLQMSNMKVSPVINVVLNFFKRTTFHGFKYLASHRLFDRLFWLSVCAASACSAGVLCDVLWARFLHQPAIVALKDHKDLSDATKGMPLVIVCPSQDQIAANVVEQFKGITNKTRLTSTLERVIRKEMTGKDHLTMLEKHMDELGMSLPDALVKYSPVCHDMISSCRWQRQPLLCRRLFRKQFTAWGLCCVLDPVRLQNQNTRRMFDHLETTRRLDIALTCSNASISYYGCQLLAVYNSDANIVPQMLHQGMSYWLRVTSTVTLASTGSLLNINGRCVPDDRYSKLDCVAKCMEHMCGCSDPLKTGMLGHGEQLPFCRTSQLNCLRSTTAYESSCVCYPSCTKFKTDMSVDTSSLGFINYTFDPLYHGLNPSKSNVVYLEIRLRESKEFFVLPLETWFTLLSSLGGVFNMFLGVGLFSALEFLFLLIKLPLAAMRKSMKIHVSEAQYH